MSMTLNYVVEIDQSIEAGKEELEFATLQDAWSEFVNQVSIGQEEEDDGPKSKYANDGLIVRLIAQDLASRSVLFQYDNRYGHHNLSLMHGYYGREDEAILDSYELSQIDF